MCREGLLDRETLLLAFNATPLSYSRELNSLSILLYACLMTRVYSALELELIQNVN